MTDFASSGGCNRRDLMLLKFYALDNYCAAKAMSEFRATEERFGSLDECCRSKFPQSVSDCCEAGDNGCSLSGIFKFIPVSISSVCLIPILMLADKVILAFYRLKKWQDQICYTKDENLLADWERAFAKTTLRECCEHNMHYDVGSCCDKSEGGC